LLSLEQQLQSPEVCNLRLLNIQKFWVSIIKTRKGACHLKQIVRQILLYKKDLEQCGNLKDIWEIEEKAELKCESSKFLLILSIFLVLIPVQILKHRETLLV